MRSGYEGRPAHRVQKRQLYHNQAISPQQTDPTVNKIWMRHGHRETLATKGGNRIPHTATRVNHER
jgi:hypothetical protein